MNRHTIINETMSITHTIRHFTMTRNIVMGASLAYCVAQEKYWHIPIIVVLPSPYAGYHAFKNQDAILNLVKELK